MAPKIVGGRGERQDKGAKTERGDYTSRKGYQPCPNPYALLFTLNFARSNFPVPLSQHRPARSHDHQDRSRTRCLRYEEYSRTRHTGIPGSYLGSDDGLRCLCQKRLHGHRAGGQIQLFPWNRLGANTLCASLGWESPCERGSRASYGASSEFRV